MPNLSLNGAFLRAFFVPPTNSQIVITLRTPLLKNVVTLESEVVRMEPATEYRIAGFAVRFCDTSVDLIELVANLISQPSRQSKKRKPFNAGELFHAATRVLSRSVEAISKLKGIQQAPEDNPQKPE